MEKTSKVSTTAMMVCCMAIYFLGPTMGGVEAAMGKIAQAFPEAGSAIGYIISAVSLGAFFGSLIVSAIGGKRVRYRTIALISLALYTVFGIMPYFIGDSFGIMGLIAPRFILGLALGLFTPIPPAVISAMFPDEQERATKLGLGTAMYSVGGVLCQLCGGVLASISWESAFLFYAVGLVVFVICLIFLKEPEMPAEEKDAVAESGAGSRKVGGVAYLILVVFMLTQVALGPVMMYNAVVMEAHGIGGPSIAGVSLALFVGAGAIGSALLGPVYHKLGTMTWTLCAVLTVIGLGVVVFDVTSGAASLPLYLLGLFVAGLGMVSNMACCTQLLSLVVSPVSLGFAMGLFGAAQQFGNFLGTPASQLVMGLTGSADYITMFIFSVIVFVVLAICMFAIGKATDRYAHGDKHEVISV